MTNVLASQNPTATNRRLLSGNEAIALGAWEAGVAVGCGYPGTPSTEILEALFEYPDLYCEWSVNEKVALEVGLGAALAGGRALVTMKHVGVNVAADPLFTAAYTGVNAGLVIVTADDPSMHSSQNEQDNRHYAIAAKIPMFEPSDAAEALEFTKAAFEMSEAYDTPVFLRTTTRLSHSKSVVEVADPATVERPRHERGFTKNPAKYVMIPGNARGRRVVVEEHLRALAEVAETHPANRIESLPGRVADTNVTAGAGGTRVGVITSGVPYTYVREAFENAPGGPIAVDILTLGIVHPLPRRMIEEFARTHDTVYVVEELDPVIETQVRSWGIGAPGSGTRLIGKDAFPSIGEFSAEVVRAGLGLGAPAAEGSRVAPALAVPPRPPVLCAGCPHGHVYAALRDKGMVVSGDIGCYSLGVLPPYNAMDTLVDMGASITMAHGMDAVLGHDPARPTIAAVIGDSTFAHSGLTGLLNACWNKRDGLYIVLDNGTTAMTGTQPNPLSGERMGREDAWALSYPYLAKAFGIPDENFAQVDAHDRAAVTATIDELADRRGVRLLAVVGLCVIEAKELSKAGKLEDKREDRRLVHLPLIDVGGPGRG